MSSGVLALIEAGVSKVPLRDWRYHEACAIVPVTDVTVSTMASVTVVSSVTVSYLFYMRPFLPAP